MSHPANSPARIVPVILSGGSGTRLWPMSRAAYPKQFLKLGNEERTLIQDTIARVADSSRFTKPLVVCNAEHRFIVAEQLREIGVAEPTILLEPAARNTAPALAIAALQVAQDYGADSLMLMLASDHIIEQPEAFLRAVTQAESVARDGALVTFGITPTRADTGFGYIQSGAKIAAGSPVHKVQQFVEKPDAARAETYLKNGDYAWNSGIFLLTAKAYLAELKLHAPAVLKHAQDAFDKRINDLDFIRIDGIAFTAAPSISIDYAVMEKTAHAAVIAVDCGWSDAGAWDALWNIADKNAAGNVTLGEVHAIDSKNCYLRAEGAAIATLGVEDLVVVTTKDAVLVAHKSQAQQIKTLVDEIKTTQAALVAGQPRVYRPWGYYETVDIGERHQVKRICVHPGAQLSLQLHHHRAEHWVIVKGMAEVTLEDGVHTLRENESIYVPLGAKHRIANPGKHDLELIEVQSGNYLGEDDIVRFEDKYGRGDAAAEKKLA